MTAVDNVSDQSISLVQLLRRVNGYISAWLGIGPVASGIGSERFTAAKRRPAFLLPAGGSIRARLADDVGCFVREDFL